MGRMNEHSQQEEERENLSGNDDYEAWIHAMEAEFKTVLRVPVATVCPTDSGLEKPF